MTIAERPEPGALSRRAPQLFAYPKSGIDYCDELYRTTAELGVEAIEGQWAGRWILKHVRSGDVVHIHWPSFLYSHRGGPPHRAINMVRFVALLSIIRLLGARIVWTAHNLYPHEGGRKSWRHRLARRLVVRLAERIFVHSPTAAQIVSREFGVPPSRLRQIWHGHWISLYPRICDRAEARQRLGLPADAVVYGFVGACRPYKNLEALVEALPRMAENSHLLIAGKFSTDAYQSKVKSLITPALANRVHLISRFLRDDEIMTIVSSLDALVLSYRDILTSGAVMLGLSAGIPVVAPNIGSMADVINDGCGVLYDPQQPDGLANAMLEVSRRTYSPTGIIAHAMTFDWYTAAQAAIDVVSSLNVTV